MNGWMRVDAVQALSTILIRKARSEDIGKETQSYQENSLNAYSESEALQICHGMLFFLRGTNQKRE